MRFLSHAETVKVFQRACVRAGIKTAYSQGFNPRLKLSLPLPRSVGVESDDDLLCLRIHREPSPVPHNPNEPRATSYESRIMAGLSSQLPDGCELLTVTMAETKISFQPSEATYMLAVRREYLNENLKDKIKRLLASANLNIQRQIDARGNVRNIDVRPFLKSIKLNDKGIVVECKITSAGSIRIDEISKLLELDYGKLATPIKRTSVQW